ncbi:MULTISPECIES: replication-associated recombination protein A [Thermodesulfobacterium]|jgi:putative ATPase|uniref:Replication-associated recombination protein A n=1 Tax=Thermodesulfobacterium commune DSM 2178 TaxID=289377 RepID=A0A075WSK5_9BACT|nr:MULTISPECIES: replication-associated recombination protein A [Thermodesulfobacterium]AIH04244.1 ATPase AAA [Thermodesulfobacterium commune DSM 2178]MBZ4682506.1 ATPase [Thermodesulfobacterium sp.]MDK2861855.1 putative ATPase [Thermodesulfobacterium sp.]
MGFDYTPLAEKLKPKSWEDFVGQSHLVGEKGLLKILISQGKPFSFILWGPPGVGKTSLAFLVGQTLKAEFIVVSAVDTTVKDLKDIISKAKQLKGLNKPTLLFIDEIHRFNKTQQSFLLPYLEKGDIFLIGATTENPSFELIPPLLSRVKTFILNPLSKDEILLILKRGLERVLSETKEELIVEPEVLEKIAEASGGDARSALNLLELSLELTKAYGKKVLSLKDLKEELLFKPIKYDKAGEEHYNLISAFHKSMRGSDPDATVYWLARMLKSGEDPLYIARRIIICAAEDVGLADPMALVVAVAAKEAFEFLGQPEGELALAEAAIYVASAPKSNSVYRALNDCYEEIDRSKELPVPLHLRNPVTRLLKNLGYGKDYKYAHDYKEGFVFQSYLPEDIKHKQFYFPSDRGIEKKIKERLKILWKGFKIYDK